MPRETFSHTARVSAAPHQVWPMLDRPTTWEGITGIDRVVDPVIDEQGHLIGFGFESQIGGMRYRGKATPRARVEGTTIGWDVDSGELRGAATVGLSPDGDGTLVEVTLEIESAGMMSAMFFPMIAQAVGGGFPETVEQFASDLVM